MSGQKIVFDTLTAMGIDYEKVEHSPAFTIEEMDATGLNQLGVIAKNLFLRDSQGKRHFLVVLREDKSADLKQLQKKLGSSRLSFASEERLEKYLGLKKGSVSPFGVLNDRDCAVEVVFDRDLAQVQRLGVHPNENTATLFLQAEDLLRVVRGHGSSITFIDL